MPLNMRCNIRSIIIQVFSIFYNTIFVDHFKKVNGLMVIKVNRV